MATVFEHVEELSNKLVTAKPGLDEDSSYYESEHRLKAIGVSTPPEMRALVAQVGWPRTYIDSVEERLDVEGFRLANASEADSRLWNWWQANDLDVESGLAHNEALIHGVSYITVAAPDPRNPMLDQDTPVIRAESPQSMHADIDPQTHQVTRALRLYQAESVRNVDYATLYLPDRTVGLERHSPGGWRTTYTVRHNLGVVPVVPLVNRSRLTERAGHSEITPELRSVTDAAARTMMNMQATAELMAVPQRLLFGVAQEALAANPENPGSVLEAYFARIIAIEDSDAHATQFTAAELMNFVNVLQELSRQAASYTGLPPQYLSFSSENPASAEAIKSSESRLVKKCERKTRVFGGAWEQVMRLAMLIMDGSVPTEAHRMETLWRDPSTPTYAAKADAVTKLVTAMTADGRPIIPIERARIDMGYSSEERREMRQWDEDSASGQLAAILSTRGRQSQQPTDEPEEAEAA